MEAEAYECDVPEESFGPGYDYKYLLLEIVPRDASGQRRWVVVSRKCHYHSGILSAFEEENDEAELRVHGGGILLCAADTGEVRVFGSSGGYGPVKKLDVVAKCLLKLGRPVGSVLATDYVRD